MKPDILAFGEILIDFTPFIGPNGEKCFSQNPGGAPMNVLASVTQLGLKSGFIGCVGNDQFGEDLIKFVKSCQIDTTYLKQDETIGTTLAFVHLAENGDRDFSFYRNPGADQMVTVKDIEKVDFTDVKVFHFGSLSMTDEPSRSSTRMAIEKAKAQGCLISYDPNYRKPLWDQEKRAKEIMQSVMDQVDILKISDEELIFMTNIEDIKEGCRRFAQTYNISLVMVTLGPKGCALLYKGMYIQVDGFKVEAVDTTGAGDSFMGAMLYHIMKAEDFNNLTKENLKDFARFANRMAATVTTRYGSASIMPSYDEIMNMI